MRYLTYADELRREERLRTKAEVVIRLMNKLGYSIEDALDFCEVDQDDREDIKELIAEMMNAVPA